MKHKKKIMNSLDFRRILTASFLSRLTSPHFGPFICISELPKFWAERSSETLF